MAPTLNTDHLGPGKETRDWPDDFSHENGCYQCRCYKCERMFYGHKRRVFCNDCAREYGATLD
jgi:hypothetical protein